MKLCDILVLNTEDGLNINFKSPTLQFSLMWINHCHIPYEKHRNCYTKNPL